MTKSFTYNGNPPMLWTSGHEAPSTKTPANVPASYTQTSAINNDEDNESIPIATAAATPRPPTSKKRKESSSANSPPQSKKTKRKSHKKSFSARPIPSSFESCTAADQTLLSMRDAGGEWPAIRAKWHELTGEETGASTLPNRYQRLKAKFSVVREEDVALLVAAKREVEGCFEGSKWELVGRVVREKGGDVYEGSVLKRQYKKLMLDGGLRIPAGVRDEDFGSGEEFEDEADDEDERQDQSSADKERVLRA